MKVVSILFVSVRNDVEATVIFPVVIVVQLVEFVYGDRCKGILVL
jgi:hypothetical protein